MNSNRNVLPIVLGLLALLPWVFLFFLFLQGNQQFSVPSQEEVSQQRSEESTDSTSARNLRRQIERLHDEIDYLEEENQSLRARIRDGEGGDRSERVRELTDQLNQEREARMEAMSEVESLRRVYNETLSEVVRMRTEQMETPTPPPSQRQSTNQSADPVIEEQEEIIVQPDPAPPARRPRDTGGGWIMPPG